MNDAHYYFGKADGILEVASREADVERIAALDNLAMTWAGIGKSLLEYEQPEPEPGPDPEPAPRRRLFRRSA